MTPLSRWRLGLATARPGSVAIGRTSRLWRLHRLWICLAFLLIGVRASALSDVTQLTAQNIDKQDYKFSIEAKRGGNTVTFKIAIEPKPEADWTQFIETSLDLVDGEKWIGSCPLARSLNKKGVDIDEFEVSVECLAKSRFTFAVGAEAKGKPMPAGDFYWFYLKDFADLDKAALMGKWRFASDNRKAEIRELRPDGTFIQLAEDMTSSADGKVYKWEVVQHDLILNLADGEKEVYSLPLDPKGAGGRDSDGMKVVATKLAPETAAAAGENGARLIPPPVIPYAIPVPGKPGFVMSPFDKYKGYIDVRGFPSGTEVKDPYSGKSFLVP